MNRTVKKSIGIAVGVEQLELATRIATTITEVSGFEVSQRAVLRRAMALGLEELRRRGSTSHAAPGEPSHTAPASRVTSSSRAASHGRRGRGGGR